MDAAAACAQGFSDCLVGSNFAVIARRMQLAATAED
jgi:hypothetical protein